MKIEIEIDDLSKINFNTFNGLDDLLKLNDIIDKELKNYIGNEIAEGKTRLFAFKYDEKVYRHFVDICMGLSLLWLTYEDWSTLFIPSLKEFILDATNLDVNIDPDVHSSEINEIFKMFNIPFKCRKIESNLRPYKIDLIN